MDVTAIKPEIAEAVKTVLTARLEKSDPQPEVTVEVAEPLSAESVVAKEEPCKEECVEGIVDIAELPEVDSVVKEEEIKEPVSEEKAVVTSPSEFSLILEKLAALEASLDLAMQSKVDEVKKSFDARFEDLTLKSESALAAARSQVEALVGTVARQEALICELKTLPSVRKSFDANVVVRPEPSDVKAQKPLSREELTFAAIQLFKEGKLTADETRNVSVFGNLPNKIKQGMLERAARK